MTSNLFAQSTFPKELYGIWEGKDRFVFFEEVENQENPKLVVILKTYYGWYYDRAAEPESYKGFADRERNNSIPRKPEDISYKISEIYNWDSSQGTAWELELKYGKHEYTNVPLAIYDDCIYLNFFTKNLTFDEDKNPIITSQGFWQGNALSKGIKIASQVDKENIPGYIIDEDDLFDVRYWKSDMELSDASVTFTYGNKSFIIQKFIQSARNLYSCTTGRSKKVRNTMPPFKFSEDDFYFNDYKTIMIPKQEPYLKKIADKNTLADLIEIVNKNNARRLPPDPPRFPEKNLDYHWDLIVEFEKNYPMIQEVRKRQQEYRKEGIRILKEFYNLD